MITITCHSIERTYSNEGVHRQQALDYTLTGLIRAHDRVRYDEGSDIPEFHLSVKASGFTLMSGNICEAQDFEGILTEYATRTASTKVAYVTVDMTAYIMTISQFCDFCRKFCRLEKESKKNGGRYKVRMKKENTEVLSWLANN